MTSFTDTSGREWPVTITVATIKRVRELISIDLMECLATENPLLDRMAIDPVLLVDVLYCICKPAVDERGLTDIEFGESLSGDVIEQATSAFIEALVSFFPRGQRILLEKSLTIRKSLETKVEKGMAKNLETITEEKIDEAVKALFEPAGS